MTPLPPGLLASVTAATAQVTSTQDFRSYMVLVYCSGFFFFGVAASIVLYQLRPAAADAPPRWRVTLARVMISVIMFAVTYPAQAYVVNNPLAGSQLAPSDQLRQLLSGAGTVPLEIFAFGVIMLLGAVAFDLFLRLKNGFVAMFAAVLGAPKAADGG